MYKTCLKEIFFYSHQFYNYIFQKYCSNCHYSFVIPNAKYCPICGNDSICWGKGWENMIYKSFELDETGKAKICPRCKNEILISDGEYCQVCGCHLINKCCGLDWRDNEGYLQSSPPCDKPLTGDARFCAYCKAETTFHKDNLFPEWEDEANNSKEIKQIKTQAPNNKVKDIFDTTIPF
jgi:hypothetical protein